MRTVEMVNGGMGIKNPMLAQSRFTPQNTQELGKLIEILMKKYQREIIKRTPKLIMRNLI